MNKYRKLIVAGLGVVFIAVTTFTGLEVPFLPEQVVLMAEPLLVAWGVWGMSNT